MSQRQHYTYIPCLRTGDFQSASISGRKYVSKDPAGYALQTLEAALLQHDIKAEYFFTAPSLAILELAPRLAEIPRERDRNRVLRDLVKHVSTNDEYRAFICTKLPHLLHFVSCRERVSLLNYALSLQEPPARAAVSFALIRSAKDTRELLTMVSEKRASQLLRLRHKELREIVAKAVYLREFEAMPFPTGLSRSFTEKRVKDPRYARMKVRERLHEMHHSLKRHIEAIDSHKRIARTRTAREFRRSLKEALSTLTPHVGLNGASPRHRLSRMQGAELANLLSLKVRLELLYGIHFARGSGMIDRKALAWRIPDMRAVNHALERMPLGHVLMTPLLHQFIRIPGSDAFGYRRPSGSIAITDEARRDHSLSRAFSGLRSSLIVAIHEMGHSIQIGDSPTEVTFERTTGAIKSPADPLFDFQGFCSLSGWRVITEQPWSLIFDNEAVRIGEQMYPLNRRTRYHGVPTVINPFTEGGNRYLLGRDSGAQFGVRENGCLDPWEDWAEGFCEYMLTPERFMVFSPEKFLYFHTHFRMYQESSELIQSLYKRLRSYSYV